MSFVFAQGKVKLSCNYKIMKNPAKNDRQIDVYNFGLIHLGSFQLAQGFNFHTPLFLPDGNSANADLLHRSAATQVRDGLDLFLRARTSRGT
jgi:hypothetical protein